MWMNALAIIWCFENWGLSLWNETNIHADVRLKRNRPQASANFTYKPTRRQFPRLMHSNWRGEIAWNKNLQGGETPVVATGQK